MAKKPDREKILRQLAKSLIDLSGVLSRYAGDVISNADIIKSAANDVSRGGDTWRYEVVGLSIKCQVPQNTIPAHCPGPLSVELSVDIKGGYDPGTGHDNILGLTLNIVARSADHKLISAWHFDRHIGEAHSDDAHPLFHFQHGGHVMKEHEGDLGRMLLLPAPRIAFPPIDAVLSIDFALSNYAGAVWKQLRDIPEYRNLVVESQERYWAPYVAKLAEWWQPGPKDRAKIAALWPQLLN